LVKKKRCQFPPPLEKGEQKSVETFALDAAARAIDDLEAWLEGEAAYAEYQRTGEAVPLSAMENWAKSWGTVDALPPPGPRRLARS
jgi:hypothetical protein